MKIRAAVLHRMGQPMPYERSAPLSVEELDLDPPGEGEVLVRVRAAGLCHSDLSVIDGNRPRPMPMALGHEAAGEVVELGPGVSDFKPGDHVVMVFVPSCGLCSPCTKGRPALCEPGAQANGAGTLLSGARRLHRDGRDIHHHLGVSAFAEYVVCAQNSLVKVDRSLSFDEAALFGCAVLTGAGAVMNTAQVPPDATVAVIGLGGVGLNAVLAANVAGAREVVAIDLHDDKLILARELGATVTVNAGLEECAEQVCDATEGGVDFAFEMAGAVSAMNLAYRITRRGGTTVTAGLPPPDAEFSLSQVGLVAEERTIKGSYIGSCVPRRDVPRFISLYQEGKLPVDKLMTGVVDFAGLNAAFDRLATGHTVRQILQP